MCQFTRIALSIIAKKNIHRFVNPKTIGVQVRYMFCTANKEHTLGNEHTY